MLVYDFFASVLFAVMASTLSVYLLRRSGYKIAYFWLFLLVLLATWAGGVWISPVGPDVGGLFLLPFIIAGLLVILFLLAFTKQSGPYGRKETIELLEKVQREKDIRQITTISLNLFFYFILILLLVAIIVHYATKGAV